MALTPPMIPRLYVIANRNHFDDDHTFLARTIVVAKWLIRFQQTALQIRITNASSRFRSRLLLQFRNELETFKPFGLHLLANTSLSEAIKLGYSGVHLSEKNRPTIPIDQSKLPPNFLVGSSVHNLHGIRSANNIGAHFSVLSPLFIAKSKNTHPMGIDKFKTILEHSPLPTLALGGIIPTRVQQSLDSGACGIATCSSVMNVINPDKELNLYQEILHLPLQGDTNVV